MDSASDHVQQTFHFSCETP